MRKELTAEQKVRKAAYARQYRQNHKPEEAARARRYHQDHKVEIAARAKQYQQNNKSEIAAQRKQYRQDNKPEIAAQKKQFAQENKDEIAVYHRQYYQDHKPKIAAQRKGRYSNDIDFKIKVSVTNRIGQSIKGTKQYEHSIDLLGCTPEYAHKHLERQFQSGMTWDNWGKYGWHIDHIIPLSYFNLSDPEQQKRAWHYTNLRPLWAKENMSKSAKIIEIQLTLI